MTELLAVVLGGLLAGVPSYLHARTLRDDNRRHLALLLARTPAEALANAAVVRLDAAKIARPPEADPVRRPVQLD